MKSFPSGLGEIFLRECSNDPDKLKEVRTLFYKVLEERVVSEGPSAAGYLVDEIFNKG